MLIPFQFRHLSSKVLRRAKGGGRDIERLGGIEDGIGKRVWRRGIRARRRER